MIEGASSVAKQYERKGSCKILGGQSHVYWFLSYLFNSLHVKHRLQWNTLQKYSVSVEWLCFQDFVLQTLLVHNILIFIKEEACSFALPPAFIRQRVIAACPITVLK